MSTPPPTPSPSNSPLSQTPPAGLTGLPAVLPGGTRLKITSYGAAQTVTGSNHLLEMGGQRILLDAGVFQGGAALEELNSKPFAYDPRALHAMVLSHAHNDHTGRLPKLVKEGFEGPIYATRATRALAEFILLDSAKLQREELERDLRKGRTPTQPLFNEEDVARALGQFKLVEFDQAFPIGSAQVRLLRAGHIPGSASVVVDADAERFVFSGDIGNRRKDVMVDPVASPDATVALMESTYGDRDHRPYEQTLEEFSTLLRGALRTGGKILIPSFALERTQDVLYQLARLEEAGHFPGIPVYVDSPLAAKVETVYSSLPGEFDPKVQEMVRRGTDPFRPRQLQYTRTVDDSRRLNDLEGPAVIIAGSGMMTGGRILHHMIHQLGKPETTLMIVGFQPEGGLGRRLIDHADEVRIMGQSVRVRAQVRTVNGFSAHADRTELLRWSAAVRGEVRLVHGEISSMESLRAAQLSRGTRCEIQKPTGYLPSGGRREEAGE